MYGLDEEEIDLILNQAKDNTIVKNAINECFKIRYKEFIYPVAKIVKALPRQGFPALHSIAKTNPKSSIKIVGNMPVLNIVEN